MSFQTWLQEFYPISASDFVKNNPDISDKDLVKFAIKTWEGLTKENIYKHDLNYYEEHTLFANDIRFERGWDSCSLCIKYNNYEDKIFNCPKDCSKNGKSCPLFRFLGHACFDDKFDDRKFISEKILDDLFIHDSYECSVYTMSENNPEPMIDVLQKTLEMLEKEDCC